MDREYYEEVRARILADIEVLDSIIQTDMDIINEAGWDVQRKHANLVWANLCDAKVDLINALWEAIDCLDFERKDD